MELEEIYKSFLADQILMANYQKEMDKLRDLAEKGIITQKERRKKESEILTKLKEHFQENLDKLDAEENRDNM